MVSACFRRLGKVVKLILEEVKWNFKSVF
jgi:hypothetical protein